MPQLLLEPEQELLRRLDVGVGVGVDAAATNGGGRAAIALAVFSLEPARSGAAGR